MCDVVCLGCEVCACMIFVCTCIVPGSPSALEEIPPTDGLLAGTCHLALALAGSLRAAVVAHFVGNMEDEGLTI